jgi:hypothetical protein
MVAIDAPAVAGSAASVRAVGARRRRARAGISRAVGRPGYGAGVPVRAVAPRPAGETFGTARAGATKRHCQVTAGRCGTDGRVALLITRTPARIALSLRSVRVLLPGLATRFECAVQIVPKPVHPLGTARITPVQ